MRVLVSSTLTARSLCEGLARQPDVEVAALRPVRIDLGEYGVSRAGAEAGSPLPYLLQPLPVFPQRPYPYSRYVGGVSRLLRRFGPDILYHVGEPSELGTAQVVRLTRRICPQARIVLFALENVHRSWRGFPKCLRGRAQRATLPRLDMVAAATHTAERLLCEQGFDPARIRVIYPGVSPALFGPHDPVPVRVALGLTDAFIVGYVGRIVQEKGVDLLIRALARLPERFALAIAGTGLAEGELRALADELGVGPRVHWLGRLAPEQIAAHLSAFDVLALPSRSLPVWQEQFGRVLAEGMLCGTPLLGSSCGCIPEIIGDAGLTFPEEDLDALCQCLLRLEADPGLRADLARRALVRGHAHFTDQTQLDGLLRAFGEVLAMPPLGRDAAGW